MKGFITKPTRQRGCGAGGACAARAACRNPCFRSYSAPEGRRRTSRVSAEVGAFLRSDGRPIALHARCRPRTAMFSALGSGRGTATRWRWRSDSCSGVCTKRPRVCNASLRRPLLQPGKGPAARCEAHRTPGARGWRSSDRWTIVRAWKSGARVACSGRTLTPSEAGVKGRKRGENRLSDPARARSYNSVWLASGEMRLLPTACAARSLRSIDGRMTKSSPLGSAAGAANRHRRAAPFGGDVLGGAGDSGRTERRSAIRGALAQKFCLPL